MNVKLEFLIVLLQIFIIKSVYCAKILYFSAIPALSHQKLYQEIWTELSLRGHQVVAVTPNPKFNKSLTNLTEYDISSLYEFKETFFSSEHKKQFFKKPNFIGMIIRQFIIQYIGRLATEFVFSHQEVKRLVAENDSFDVCVLEWLHSSWAVYAHLFKCPFIGISSNGMAVQMLDTIGNPNHPIVSPEQDLPILRNEITFFESAWSLFWLIFVRIHYHYFCLPSADQVIKKFYGKDVPYLGDLERNVSLLIVNRNVVFHRPVPNLPNVIDVGAVRYDRPAVKIDQVSK